jgi:hypothetical protein
LNAVLDTTPPHSKQLEWQNSQSTTPIPKCGLMAALLLLSSPSFAQDVMQYHVKHLTLLDNSQILEPSGRIEGGNWTS